MLATKQTQYVGSYQPQIKTRERQTTREQNQRAHSLVSRVATFSCIALCGAVLWALAGVGARIDSTNYQIAKMQGQVKQVAANNAILNAQVDQLQQPSRILEIAQKMGMQPAHPLQISSSH